MYVERNHKLLCFVYMYPRPSKIAKKTNVQLKEEVVVAPQEEGCNVCGEYGH